MIRLFKLAVEKLLTWIGSVVFILVLFAIPTMAQDVCPPTMVCITRDAAVKALADADKVIALEKESKAKDDAIAGLRGELNNMRIQFAEKAGENSALKQNAVSDRAIITELLKYTKKRCLPFAICIL